MDASTSVHNPPVSAPVCIDCGAVCTPSGITTGYGRTPAGEIVCFACCGARDRAELRNLPVGGRTALYLSETYSPFRHYFTGEVVVPQYPDCSCLRITNWPNTLTDTALVPYGAHVGNHNMAAYRLDVWFIIDGAHFHGVCYGSNTQILHVRKIKPLAH